MPHHKPRLQNVIKQGVQRIKVQLDARTVITLTTMKHFGFWKQRYPNARVIA